MRKALLIVAMLLLVTPVMATTTITAEKEGAVFTASDGNKVQTVRIDYSGDVNVRAFALDINIDPGPTFRGIRNFKTGEGTAASKGYGIFPGRFRDYVNPSNPDPCYALSTYNPTTHNESDSANTGMGFSKMIVEMGTLHYGDGNKPGLSGTLFRFDVNNEGLTGTFNLYIAGNTLRGKVVNNDGIAIEGVTFVGTPIVFPEPCIDIPAILNHTMTDANTDLTTAGFTNPPVIAYECNDTYANGKVCRQDTGCVASSATIHYWVSTGPCCINIPNILGKTKADANATIIAAGLTVGTISYQYSDTVPDNNVMTQDTGCVAPLTAVNYKSSLGRFPTPAQIIYPRWDPDSNIPVLWSAVAGTTYELERSANGGAWTNVYTGSATFKSESVPVGFYKYQVRAKNADSISLYRTGTYDCNAYLSKCFPDTNATNLTRWKEMGRPDCWCKASTLQEPNGSGYQCDGDADGAAYGGNPSTALRIYSGDLSMVTYNWKKAASNLTMDPNVTLAGKLKIQAACADIDHRYYGGSQATGLRVYSGDLSVVTNNWKFLNSSTATATNRLPGNCPR